MCRDDGMVFDDGVATRLAADRFLITTTTGNAGAVLDWLEEWLQTEWPDLDVFCTSVTEEWANATLAGPGLAGDPGRAGAGPRPRRFPVHDDARGRCRRHPGAALPDQLLRRALLRDQRAARLRPGAVGSASPRPASTPYGTEAMHVLRAEKGYVIVGQETDGSVTPVDLGLGRMIAADKDCLGKRSLSRADLVRADRKQLVGLQSDRLLSEGAALTAEQRQGAPIVGHVTSSYFGPRIGRNFALALVKGGRARHGEEVWAEGVSARIAAPVLYDPEGRRRDG